MGSNDSHTTVTTQSWFSRMGQSIKGVLVGLIIFIAAFPFLWWNEGKAVRVAQDLEKGKGAVVSLAEPKVDSSKEGKLIYFTGDAVTTETITDPILGISEQAISIIREVQMYQWEQSCSSKTEKQLGGSEKTVETCTYQKTWSSSAINSGSFKEPGHNNPPMEFEGATTTANNVAVGDFTLPSGLIKQISGGQPLAMNDQILANLPGNLQGRAKISGSEIYITSNQSYGYNPSGPQIGDMKVSVKVVRSPQKVSVVGKQQGNTIVAEQGEGTDIFWLRTGVASAAEMFAAAESSNVMWTWIKRLAGFIMMFIGISMIFKPVVTLGDVVPIVGSILNFGIGIFAFVIALIFTLLTIALAWLAARPIIGVTLLVIVVGAFVAFKVLGKKKAPQAAA